MAFAVARIDRVEACAGNAGSWSLDLSSIYAHALRSGWGSFRFTPPAQVLNASNVALDLFDAEGGQPARLARYTANMRTLYDGVRGLGLTPCLPPDVQGPIIVNVHAPSRSDLQRFVDALKARGVLISNFYSPSSQLSCGLHRGDLAGRHGERRHRDGRGVGRTGHRTTQGGVCQLATVCRRLQRIASSPAARPNSTLDRGGARRREFRGPGRRTSERIVGPRRRAARASQRQSLGRIPQSRP